MKPADLLMATAKLIIAAGYKMKEQARQDMAEEDLGGGMFDQDVKDLRETASKCNEPQQYDADEQATLDEQLTAFNTPLKRLKKYKTGNKLMDMQLRPHRYNENELNKRILDAIRITNVLRSAQAKYRFFDEFLFHIIRNKMKKGANQTSFSVKTLLVALTHHEAGRIARSFSMTLLSNATAEAAVDEHIRGFVALAELDREYRWFRPMMVAIAAELLSGVAWGVKARASIGAAVSFADLLSDAFVVKTYLDAGQKGDAVALMAMVGVNLLTQLLIVMLQNRGLKKDKVRTIVLESVAVVTFTKPGLDAYYVASSADMKEGASLNPIHEMGVTRVGEMVFEALPGLVLQLVVLMTAKEKKARAVVSVLLSAASAAMTGTMLFWDTETDPGAKHRNPKWIGLIPDFDRGPAFVVVMVISGAQVLAKATATALLLVTKPAWLWLYFLGDHGLLLLYRVVRRDAHFFMAMPAAASYFLAPVFQVVMKIVVDFTGSMQMRLPALLGGQYWLFALFSSQVSVFVSVHLYNE
ncbi:hypothetical protein TeGR_g5344 [Tetraparma gracilis]|uniref:Uncharacterized protein n=1 Tax=Tetraparma gracilis TaxID=2962635 RepID=A0ABQ6N1D8_9STRA|nr:hypothetical protein TeGR_g5344 [Tetraparma gracilis]